MTEPLYLVTVELKLKNTYAHTVICFLFHLIYKCGLYKEDLLRTGKGETM
jgi:hypothetical protein